MVQTTSISDETKGRVSDEQREAFKKRFWSPDLPKNFDVARRILEEYSEIPASEVNDHVLKIRDKGWEVFPFPCIGQFRFLELDRSLADPRYQVALARLQREGSNECFLDVGCFVGQVARALAYSGVPPTKIYGTDLEQAYLDLGFNLFRDEHKMPRDHFISGDMLLEPRDPRLDPFVGKMTLINASSFFHLFDMPLQVKAAKRCVEFLNSDAEDVMIFGRMTGRAEAGGLVPGPGTSKLFVHSAESWAQLWKQVAEETGTEWRTEYELIKDDGFEKENPQYASIGIGRSRFGAYRMN